MISCINYENLDVFGKILHSQFKLRYESFIQRQDYNVNTFKGMEYDQYDTPAASYLVYHDNDGNALGVNRLTPTKQGSMLKDLWPSLVKDHSNLSNDRVWEGTRYCISKNINTATRQQIIHEMAIAYLEFGLDLGLEKIVGMMPTYIYRSVFEKQGINMEYLGDVQIIGKYRIRAVAIPINQEQLNSVRLKTGINSRILRYSIAYKRKGEYGQAA